MRPIRKTTCSLLRTIVLLFLLSGSNHLFSQTPPPPPPPPSGGTNNGHGLGGNQGPANAPAGNGLGILLILAAAYSGTTVYRRGKASE